MNIEGVGDLVPLYDQIIVRTKDQEETNTGSIIIPETIKTKEQIGEVVAVGEGRLLDNGDILPLKVEVGDVVVLKEFTGTDVVFDNTSYLFVREDDLVGVIRGS